MEDFIGIIIFLLFFIVLPALDKRKKKQRRARKEGQRAQTTFEQGQSGPTPSPTAGDGSRAGSGGLGDLWAELERLSKGELPEPIEVPLPAPPEDPRGEARHLEERMHTPSEDEDASDRRVIAHHMEPAPKKRRVVPRKIDTTRRPVPDAEPVAATRHRHRRAIGEKRTRPPLLRPGNLRGIDLRRAIIYKEVLGPPVSLRNGVAPVDTDL